MGNTWVGAGIGASLGGSGWLAKKQETMFCASHGVHEWSARGEKSGREGRPVADRHLDRESMAAGRARRRTIECVRSHFLGVTKAGNVDPKDVDKVRVMFNG